VQRNERQRGEREQRDVARRVEREGGVGQQHQQPGERQAAAAGREPGDDRQQQQQEDPSVPDVEVGRLVLGGAIHQIGLAEVADDMGEEAQPARRQAGTEQRREQRKRVAPAHRAAHEVQGDQHQAIEKPAVQVGP
jgi:hypothetical protein